MKGENTIYGFRRSHEQILADVLKLCKTPKSKTHVLHNSNTNFKLLQSYLYQLQTAQLLEILPEKAMYATTKKGAKYLKTWKQLLYLMSPPQLYPPFAQRIKYIEREKLLAPQQ